MAKTKKAQTTNKRAGGKTVETIRHTGATRKNIPSAEHQSVLEKTEAAPRPVKYLRNTDLDPQLVWRGKDEQDWTDLVVQAPPLYIQDRVHPKLLVDDLLRQSRQTQEQAPGAQFDLFGDFNGIPEGVDRTEFYQHDQNWSNRMILGDSLQVMASLAEREGLRGKVQCIYIDPPYGIKFNSNFQWSTTSRDVKDGNVGHITREPEQVKAFRDTWRDGIHSYLTYLRDRLTVTRDLLAESGSIFLQIGDENVHRVRSVLDEVFGDENFIGEIGYHSTSGSTSDYLSNPKNYVLWYARNSRDTKFRKLLVERSFDPQAPGPWQIVESNGERGRLSDFVAAGGDFRDENVRIARLGDATSQRQGRAAGESSAMGFPVVLEGKEFRPSGTRGWSTTAAGMSRATRTGRLHGAGQSLSLVRYFDESPYFPLNSSWEDTGGTIGATKVYVVQTNVRVVQRCVLMASDPGDLVLDPTCGSGTTAAVAEQWGRRWITIDTSRVAIALARARVMGVRHPFYLLADSEDGLRKQAEVTGEAYVDRPTYGNVRQGFVYERVPHVTLKSIANNVEIDVIWEEHQPNVEAALAALNQALRGHKTPVEVTTGGRAGGTVQFDASEKATFTMPSGDVVSAFELLEWEVPREAPADWPKTAAVSTALARHMAETGRVAYDFAVVDEAQDLSVSQLRFFAALGGDHPNALFFAGDLGQRIFQQPFSWKSLGVDVRGRSRTLRVNYRTSHQIREQADRLLGPEIVDVDGNVETRRETVSVFNGPPPVVCVCATADEETAVVAAWVKERLANGVQVHEIGMFVRSSEQLDRAQAAAKAAGVPSAVLDEHVEIKPGRVSLSTMHLAKGLEFKAVAVIACDDEVVPLQARIEAVGDDADLKEVYDTERHLLYVACTRARDFLHISAVDPASEFLDDMR